MTLQFRIITGTMRNFNGPTVTLECDEKYLRPDILKFVFYKLFVNSATR